MLYTVVYTEIDTVQCTTMFSILYTVMYTVVQCRVSPTTVNWLRNVPREIARKWTEILSAQTTLDLRITKLKIEASPVIYMNQKNSPSLKGCLSASQGILSGCTEYRDRKLYSLFPHLGDNVFLNGQWFNFFIVEVTPTILYPLYKIYV